MNNEDRQQPNVNQSQHQSQQSVPHYQTHNNSHYQFISSTPLPNPRQLFPDNSRSRRGVHPSHNAMRVNISSANAHAQQSGFVSPGPGTPRQKQVPHRTTKVSQKLVLFPEDQEEAEDDDDDDDVGIVENDYTDPVLESFREETEFRKRKRGLHGRAPTQSELLTKEQRNAKGLARVDAYCTSEEYDMKKLASFLRDNHGVQPRLYDEALYAAYHFPLIPGKKTKFMSAPPVRSPGGGSVLDKQLEQYEEYTGDDYSRSPEERALYRRSMNDEEYNHLRNEGSSGTVTSRKLKQRHRASSRASRNSLGDEPGHNQDASGQSSATALESNDYFAVENAGHHDNVIQSSAERHPNNIETLLEANHNPVVNPFMGGEVFFLNYGVVVFWNMTLEQEEWILEDIAQFESKKLSPDDIQTEEFHFEYAGHFNPRIYNDMITLRGGNHMVKLTISHAISQSVKLALYECNMDDTIDDTKIIPIQLAQTGVLNYSRPQITKISGHLFQLRMNVDLVSNVLDTPEIFWSEPELQPLYNAIRGYLEIGQRAKVLRDRCLVISDLLTMLRDDISSNNMTYITWIIIILIVIAVIVATGEIFVKYLTHFGNDGASFYIQSK
ncbi:hypothetical protein BGZ76_000033 [Entomortierella beljakovae]|nr:hypothetical protein BGZ76_000033 [Entomortierella beljakovae]